MVQQRKFVINGETYEVAVEPHWTLLYVLREKLGLTGTKQACGNGECGNCTVLMNGKPVLSCLMFAVESDGKEIITIEGIARDGKLHPIQEAFLEHHAVACGHCIPAMILFPTFSFILPFVNYIHGYYFWHTLNNLSAIIY